VPYGKNEEIISVLCVYLFLVSGLVACAWREVLRLLDPFTDDGMFVPNETQNCLLSIRKL
jgi:hypothetical protein